MITVGCDFHTRFQQVAMLDPTTGEVIERRLEHENGDAEKFYGTLPGPACVGMEATIHSPWFERLLHRYGHELWVGDAAEIRARRVRKQKTDSRDALHILDLLVTNRFPGACEKGVRSENRCARKRGRGSRTTSRPPVCSG